MQQSKQDERTDKNVASGCFYRTCSAGFTEMPSLVHVVVTSLILKLCQAWPLTSPCWLAGLLLLLITSMDTVTV